VKQVIDTLLEFMNTNAGHYRFQQVKMWHLFGLIIIFLLALFVSISRKK